MKKLFALIIFFLLTANAQGATYWVSTSGSNANACTNTTTPQTTGAKQTIAAGIACLTAGNGDTLNIRAGTYNERIQSDLYTLPSGTSYANAATITAYSPGGVPETVILRSPNGGYGVGIQLQDVRYLIFQNLILDGTDCTSCLAGSHPGILVGFYTVSPAVAHHIKFINMEVKNWHYTLVVPDGDFCEFIGGSYYDSLAPGGYGFYASGDDNIIEHVKVYNNRGYGIHTYSDNQHTHRNKIRFNEVYENGFDFTTSDGIVVGSGDSNEVYGNLVYNNYTDGIAVSFDATNTKVYNNTVYNNGRKGTGYGGIVSGTDSKSIIQNNIIYQNGSFAGQVDIADSNPAGTIPTFGGNFCGQGNTGCATIGNPSFASTTPGNANFLKLNPTSPAIGAGIPLTGCPGAAWCTDLAGVTRPVGGTWDSGAYEYGGVVTPPITVPPQLVLALPLDEGTTTTAVDVSGQKNNATLVGGVTWDNAGKYGKAVMLDGTGYLNVPASASLALAPGMTLEAWVYPTVASSGFTTAIRQDRYFLYASSDPGYCGAPALAPLGGYFTGENRLICATSMPPPNEWSHLAVTYDGVAITFFLNGNIVASQSQTDAMVPASANVTIGASQFGENFIGKIDQPMVYNYSRTPAQIVSDMNTPLIGGPGKYVEISAPTSVEISSASSLEISAN